MTAARCTVSLGLAIRPCRPEDLERLEWFGAFRHHREIFRETFARHSAGEVLMLVAETRGFPVGQAWLDFRPGPLFVHPKLWAVRVIEPLQRLGIGARLVGAAERAAAETGYRVLELGVEKDNRRALAFYEGLGWRIVRERRDSYSYTTPEGRTVTHPLDELVLEKRLDQARSIPRRA